MKYKEGQIVWVIGNEGHPHCLTIPQEVIITEVRENGDYEVEGLSRYWGGIISQTVTENDLSDTNPNS